MNTIKTLTAAAATLTVLTAAAGCEETWEEKHTTKSVDQFNDSVEREVEAMKDHMGLDEKQKQGTRSDTMAALEARYEKLERELDTLTDKAEARAGDRMNQLESSMNEVEGEIDQLGAKTRQAFRDAGDAIDKKLEGIEREVKQLKTDGMG